MENLIHYGRWRRLHFGVYASLTGEPPREAALWAAVLRAGPWSILSHETAAELDGLLDKPSKMIHVTVPKPQHRPAVAGSRSTGHPVLSGSGSRGGCRHGR
jgi:hypothetical protein